MLIDKIVRAVALYCDLVARAAIDGISRGQGAAGVDVGASEEGPLEPALVGAGIAGETAASEEGSNAHAAS